jgi:hypothetical protein
MWRKDDVFVDQLSSTFAVTASFIDQ